MSSITVSYENTLHAAQWITIHTIDDVDYVDYFVDPTMARCPDMWQ